MRRKGDIQADLCQHGIKLLAEMVKQSQAAVAITQAARDAARHGQVWGAAEEAGRKARTADGARPGQDQTAQDAARRAQERPRGPRM